MNKAEFLSLIEHPELAGKIELAETEKVICEFPYWQSVRLLYVKALHEKQHFSYQSKLKLAAIYAGDRSKLFELINKSSDSGKITTTEPVIEENNVAIHYNEPSGEGNNNSEITLVPTEVLSVTENIIDEDETPLSEEEPFIEQISEPVDESTTFSNDLSTEGTIEPVFDIYQEEIIESDLNTIIEKRIKELTEQNNSYGTLEQDEIEPVIISPAQTSLSENEVTVVESESPKTESSTQAIDEDEKISVEEELAAFNVYEETAIANDLLKMQPAEVLNSGVEDFKKTDVTATAGKKSTSHSFLEWFAVLKTSEGEAKASSVIIAEGHPERSRRSAETHSDSESTDIKQSEIETETQIDKSTASIITLDDISASNKNETLNPKPETSNLIDKFIEAEPRIQPRKSAFFSPSTAARKSVMYDEDVVSETLAEIFYGQHLYDKAIKAYDKLTLMFPEKSTLFAARIQKIKEESLSGK